MKEKRFGSKTGFGLVGNETSPPYAQVAAMTSLQTNNFETLLKHFCYTFDTIFKHFSNNGETLVKHWWKSDKHLWNTGKILGKTLTNPGSEWKWKLLMAGSKTNPGSEGKWNFQVNCDEMNTGSKWKGKLHKAGSKSC